MPHKRIMQGGIMVAGALLLVTATLKSQAPARSAQVWEYSSVSGMPVTSNATSAGINSLTYIGAATICYATAQGCRNEEITAQSPDSRVGAVALMMAASKLGEQGWELTSTTEETTGAFRDRVMYFRRLKSEPK